MQMWKCLTSILAQRTGLNVKVSVSFGRQKKLYSDDNFKNNYGKLRFKISNYAKTSWNGDGEGERDESF